MRRTLTVVLCLACVPALAWELGGTHRIYLHPAGGAPIEIGTVDIRADEPAYRFDLRIDRRRFQDFFLSMREMKCLEAPAEVFCHLPYPYANPRMLAPGDLAWLEHALLFLFKKPGEFGANLRNGIYYQLHLTPTGLVGTPQAIDLNQISAPPDDLSVPPFAPSTRVDIDPAERAFGKLTIE